MKRKFWLLKTEPEEWSWIEQVKCGSKGAEWGGVRNYQASKNLRNMKIRDKCFFYHTGKEKKHKFVAVAVKALYPLKKQVSLSEIKKNKLFRDFSLVKQSRLSVMAVDLKYWKKICKMGKVSN